MPAPGGAASTVRHRPGLGAIVAIVGFLVFMFGVAGMPWASVEDEGVTRSDIQDDYERKQDAGLDNVDFLGEYAEWIWIAGLGVLGLAVLTSTLVVPSSKGARVVLGLLGGGLIGLVVNAVDDEGTFGPRVTAALMTVGVAALHAFSMFLVFEGYPELELDPAAGMWTAFAGLTVVLLGCVLGTRIERGAPAPAPGPMPAYR